LRFGERAKVRVDARYSRFVGMMKMLLPIMALALMAAIFAWPGEFDDPKLLDIGFVQGKGKEAERLTMLNPRYLGTDAQQRPFVITARIAEQDPNDQRQVTLTAVQADMASGDGAWFSIAARSGVYHQGNNSLYLVGPIDLFSDAGYEFHSGSVNIDLNAGTAETVDKVQGHGPFGTIKADRLLISERGNVLRFAGHVSLVIAPQKGS
jgi:lipopolysaccharide export system protein LptC